MKSSINMALQKVLFISLIFGFYSPQAFGQIEVGIETDRSTYSYGDSIVVKTYAINNSSEDIPLLTSLSDVLTFTFDSLRIPQQWIVFPTENMYRFEAGDSIGKTWVINPKEMGLPNQEGPHMLLTELQEFADTTYIEAPVYKGGELFVTYVDSADLSARMDLKDSLGVSVLSDEVDNESFKIDERWYVEGQILDSLMVDLKNDWRILDLFANRDIQPESTKFGLEDFISSTPKNELADSFHITSIYPNPFNPTTTLSLEASRPGKLRIYLYNSSGKKVRTIYRGFIASGMEKKFTITANALPSGTYLLKAEMNGFEQVRKITLIK